MFRPAFLLKAPALSLNVFYTVAYTCTRTHQALWGRRLTVDFSPTTYTI